VKKFAIFALLSHVAAVLDLGHDPPYLYPAVYDTYPPVDEAVFGPIPVAVTVQVSAPVPAR
jgi:hypothetical protein